jgi:hypothetical protein
MTTPYGLLRWGQAGRYTALDDRLVITALAGGRNGIVRPVSMAPAAGLAITIEAGWLAVADCADGTCAVLASDNAIEVRVGPGGAADRRDEVLAEVVDPETAQWAVSVMPPGSGGAESTGGIVLGWVHVPAGATTAEQMGLEPRAQDFSTGGAIPGPPGDRGPEGPGGPAGQSTLIVGSFGNLRTPDELPADGLIEADWDGPGSPPNDAQLQQGWALIYIPTGHLWVFAGGLTGGAPWINVGLVAGAEGPPGPEGPTGPQGPEGPAGGITDLDQWHRMTGFAAGFSSTPRNDEVPMQYRLNADRTQVYVIGTLQCPISAAINGTQWFIFPVGYRPPLIVSFPVTQLGGSTGANGGPRAEFSPNGAVNFTGLASTPIENGNVARVRINGMFPVNNPDIPVLPPLASETSDPEEVTPPMADPDRDNRRRP